jgi:hypothetical protein
LGAINDDRNSGTKGKITATAMNTASALYCIV